jgi:hypothetical protein
MRYQAPAALAFFGLMLAGCHQACGTSAPFWISADCAVMSTDPLVTVTVDYAWDGAFSDCAEAELTALDVRLDVEGGAGELATYACDDAPIVLSAALDSYVLTVSGTTDAGAVFSTAPTPLDVDGDLSVSVVLRAE